ncbi:hypothetical protein BDN70DRAFT_382423 [Pholiota conissans]|uniref:Uncharacterized protein n=1 Tax=Pholiota conissans TaxID=109636 RepID=A0A9P5YQX0_9AGAR|nr:hypothetical protein BDN70DRAFT_382423 [Pholiota conissans]
MSRRRQWPTPSSPQQSLLSPCHTLAITPTIPGHALIFSPHTLAFPCVQWTYVRFSGATGNDQECLRQHTTSIAPAVKFWVFQKVLSGALGI